MKLNAIVAALLVASTAAHAEVRFSKEPKIEPSAPSQGRDIPYVESPLINVPNYSVRHAPVVHVEPITKRETVIVPKQICGVTTVPMNYQTPIVETVRSEPNEARQLLGAVFGAALAHKAFNGNVGATVVGGAMGAGLATPPATHNRVVGYTTSTTYHQQPTCQVVNDSYERNVIVGYLVTYEDNGQRKTISSSVHPGTHVRLVTTTRTEM